jgi:predicted naringenin-chalcone synthase
MSLFVENWIEHPTSQRKFRFLTRDQSIGTKRMLIPDFSAESDEKWLYKDPGQIPSTQERMALFLTLAMPPAIRMAEEAIRAAGLTHEDITHIITVSCTGMTAPGLETLLAQALKLKPLTERYAINFLGCYAAFNAMRWAKNLADNDKNARILIVSAEVCSLHFRNDTSDDNLLSTYLFSDGVAACVITADPHDDRPGLEILHTSSALISEGSRDMGWYIGNTGFEMVLNKNVPKHIQGQMKNTFEQFIQHAGISREDIGHYAIHPGGKSILQAFENSLQLEQKDLNVSYQVLYNYGNMSSATIFYVLQTLMSDVSDILDGDLIYSAAFGPGLTVESALLKYHHHA